MRKQSRSTNVQDVRGDYSRSVSLLERVVQSSTCLRKYLIMALFAFLSSGIGMSARQMNATLKETSSLFILLDQIADFTTDSRQESSSFRLNFELLIHTFYSQRRNSPNLKEANHYFERLENAFDAYTDHQEECTADSFTAFPQGFNSTFDQKVSLEYPADTCLADFHDDQTGKAYNEFMTALTIFAKKLRTISINSKRDTLIFAIANQCAYLVVAIALTVTLHCVIEYFNEAFKAQNRLNRQQAHEMRSKYTPALYHMQVFIDITSNPHATIDHFRELRNDMQLSLSALKEVEIQQRSRLDIYKILRNKYEARPEIFGVKALMQERVDIEEAISSARCRGSGTLSPSAVQYSVVIADAITKDTSPCAVEEIYVLADQYILNHLLQNTLANAGKHTYSGNIVLTLERATDENGGRLYFSCCDTGTGISPHLKSLLFETEVATGDHRGTGLGLPSCVVFATAAGGFIRLRSTQVQDETGNGGYSDFEFAVQGKVVRIDRSESIEAVLKEGKCITKCSFKERIQRCAVPRVAVTSTNMRTIVKSSETHDTSPPIPSPSRSTSTSREFDFSFPQNTLAEARKDNYISSFKESVSEPNAKNAKSNPLSNCPQSVLPESVTIVVVDDSSLIRSCLIRTFKKIQYEQLGKSSDWHYEEFDTIEASQPCIRELHKKNKLAIICLDENLDTRGGKLRGIQGTRWLIKDLGWKGIIISSSGDADVGHEHLALGAHLNWGKPIPKQETILADLISVLSKI